MPLAARHRGSQDRLRQFRPVDQGRTREDSAPAAPGRFGATKRSGVGREYDQYGIEAFLETRAILE